MASNQRGTRTWYLDCRAPWGITQDGKIIWVAQPDQPGNSTFFFGSTLPYFLVGTWALPHIPPYSRGWVLLVSPRMSQTCFHPAQAAVGCLLWQGSKILKWGVPKYKQTSQVTTCSQDWAYQNCTTGGWIYNLLWGQGYLMHFEKNNAII